LQILIDGFAISSLYALGATGFTLIFGVSGVLNLSHGAIMMAAIIAWWVVNSFATGPYIGALAGMAASLACAFITYRVIVRPIQDSRAIPRKEKEIFVLTGTLLWGIMLQEAVAYLFTNNPKTVRPLIEGVAMIGGVRMPLNQILTAVLSWAAIGLLYLLVNRTRTGKSPLAASMNPRGLTLLQQTAGRLRLVDGALIVIAGAGRPSTPSADISAVRRGWRPGACARACPG
jgi:branched-chain amino acid transport system permease protein